MSRAAHLLQLGRRIAHLEDELVQRRREFHRLVGEELPQLPYVYRTSSLMISVAAVLGPEPRTAPEIAEDTGRQLESVRSALSKLIAKGLAIRTSPGRYARPAPPAASPTDGS